MVCLQIIQLEAHVRKGVGKTHAKWCGGMGLGGLAGHGVAIMASCSLSVRSRCCRSPVSTAYYRLLPEVTIVDEVRPRRTYASAACAHGALTRCTRCAQVRDADADELVRKCPMNVFDIEDMGGALCACSRRGALAIAAAPAAC